MTRPQRGIVRLASFIVRNHVSDFMVFAVTVTTLFVAGSFLLSPSVAASSVAYSVLFDIVPDPRLVAGVLLTLLLLLIISNFTAPRSGLWPAMGLMWAYGLIGISTGAAVGESLTAAAPGLYAGITLECALLVLIYTAESQGGAIRARFKKVPEEDLPMAS